MMAKCPCDTFRKYVEIVMPGYAKSHNKMKKKILKRLLMVLNSLNTHHSEIQCK
jgi:hypothetical protein